MMHVAGDVRICICHSEVASLASVNCSWASSLLVAVGRASV